ncbi:MAG: PASTA domain-containing protein [Pyrinomonadaceae bacterium]
MSIVKTGLSAIGKLAVLGAMAAVFLFAMGTVVYMSLQGEELVVPDIVGKNFAESETEFAALGLKLRRRADRYSTEDPNTILEQLPKPGETVKTGQMVLVVVSKSTGEPNEIPTALKKDSEANDSEKIEEMISEKPKKAKVSSNSNKKAVDTKRDVMANKSDANLDKAPNDTEKKPDGEDKSSNKSEKGATPTVKKSTATPAANKQNQAKPAATDPKLRPGTRP